MAKVNGVNKKLLAKKDMNFFAEFTANAAKAARMLGYGVAAGVFVVAVVLAFIVAFFIRNTLIKGQIRDLENLLASPEYASLEADAAKLTEELNDMTNYYYALTQMRKNVDEIDPVKTDLPDVLAKCIPNDSFVSSYKLTNSQLDIEGYTFTYYSPVDMVNMLNAKNVFTARPTITTERAEVESKGEKTDPTTKITTIDAINNYYRFTISGLLVSNVHISIVRYQDGVEKTTTLGGIETLTVPAGNSYEIPDVAEYTYAGTTYQLTKILVDGVQVEEGSFNTIIESGKYTDAARKNSEIQLFYAPKTAAPQG